MGVPLYRSGTISRRNRRTKDDTAIGVYGFAIIAVVVIVIVVGIGIPTRRGCRDALFLMIRTLIIIIIIIIIIYIIIIVVIVIIPSLIFGYWNIHLLKELSGGSSCLFGIYPR